MNRAILAFMVAAAMASPVYADDKMDESIAAIISSSAKSGAEIGVICALLEELRGIGNSTTPEESNDHLWECVRTRLDNANIGPDTAINAVRPVK